MKRNSFMYFLFFVVLCGAVSCAKKEIPPDPFFEKWRIMSKEYQGHSPSDKPRAIILEDAAIDGNATARQQEMLLEQKLPTFPVSLSMHDTEVLAVLQALVRIAGMNMILNSDLQGRVNLNVMEMPWDQVFTGLLKSQGLNYAWEGKIIRIMTLNEMEHELAFDEVRLKLRQQKLEMLQVDPLVTAVIDVKYANAANLKPNLESLLTRDANDKPRGSVVVDTSANALIVQAIEPDLMRMMRMLEQLDRPRRQIHIKAHIVETTQTTARELGIRWGGLYRGNSFGNNNAWIVPGGTDGSAATGTDPQSGDYNPIFGSGVSGQGFGINFPTASATEGGLGTSGAALGFLFGTIGGNILEVQLSALEQEGKLNILSSPSLTTLDNQTAFTLNGERVPYLSVSADGTQTQFEDADLLLAITPHIIEKDLLRLEIKVTDDAVDTSRTVAGNPFIVTKETETTLINRSGETVVISGLTRSRASEGNSGVPGLKDVPGLGRLFSGDRNDDSLQEVLIFITPYVLPEWQEGETQRSESEIEAEVDRLIQEEIERREQSGTLTKDNERLVPYQPYKPLTPR